MKQCPNCQSRELYDDDVASCPYCDTVLVPYVRNSRRASSASAETVRPVRPANNNHETPPQETPVFETHSGGRYHFRGTVVSINPTMRFISTRMKLIFSIFGGQPFQIGNPVHETNIRIEEINHERIPDDMRNLIYYGELGELGVDDDVTITAVRRRRGTVITRLYDNDIDALIRPHGMISAGLVRFLTLLAIAMIVLLVAMTVSFFTSGGIWIIINALVGGVVSLATMLLTTLGPLLVVIWVFWLLFKKR